MSRATILFVALVLAGCTASDSTEPALPLPQQYGLQESFRYRSAISEAVSLANRVLGPGAPVRLYPSWKGGEAGVQPVYEKGGGFSVTLRVPVYAVEGKNLAPEYFVFVPPKGHGVFVNVDRLPAFFRLFSPTTRIGGLPVDEPRVLAFALMHEAGHLFHEDAGSFDGTHPLELQDMLAVELTLEDVKAGRTAHLNPELRADLFALEHIKEALSDGSNMDRWMEAKAIQGTFSTTTFNITGLRVVEGFGEQGLVRRARFRDASYSHPNLELRMHVLNYLSNPDALAEELLSTFLKERSAPLDGTPLFIAPGASPGLIHRLEMP
ncbi:hypothetical protein [Corallococcus sp. 4LFB]|uniref:hypothetical protein n=1 Tax=Corallococcus sp. 4LFB TaxID=3383249 RepID=UPI003975A216